MRINSGVAAFGVFAVAAAGIAFSSTVLRGGNEPAKDTPARMTCLLDKPGAEPAEVWIDGGAFAMGMNNGYPEEGPETQVSVDGFWIDAHEVTNAQFAAFVEATGYQTIAERVIDGVTGSAVFVPPRPDAPMSAINWWKFVDGASWRQPEGPGSSIAGKDHQPVVHIAYEDAQAYAAWADRRLPTEEEWEYAARGGLDRATYEWGEEKPDDGAPKANTWQGMFPIVNSEKDGFAGLAPVGCYQPNGFNLYDMTGNVWEWTSTAYYPQHSERANERQDGAGHDPRQPGVPVNVLKGGSFLCAENYCVRYRPAARHPQELNLGTSHIGFRTVRSDRTSDRD